jgi:hypothetical protein
MVKELPTFETVCPNKNFQKSALNRLPSDALAGLDDGGGCVTERAVLAHTLGSA